MISAAEVVCADRPAYLEAMILLPESDRRAAGLSVIRPLTRDVLFPVAAAVATVVAADVRIPMGLPGHRGLIWLTLLVAVALSARRPETVVAVGATSTVATQLLHAAPGPWANGRYLAAAVLLYLVIAAPALRRRRWPVALAAAPIHLVALAGWVAGLAGAGHLAGIVSGLVSVGMAERVLGHLVFGLAAGLLGWGLVAATGLART